MSQRGATAAQRCPGRGRGGCRRRPRSLEIRFTLFTNCRLGQHKLHTAILLKLICSQCNPFFATEFLIYGFGIYGAKTSPRTVVSAQARVYWGHSCSSRTFIFICFRIFNFFLSIRICLFAASSQITEQHYSTRVPTRTLCSTSEGQSERSAALLKGPTALDFLFQSCLLPNISPLRRNPT